jgi:hypothetical protein
VNVFPVLKVYEIRTLHRALHPIAAAMPEDLRVLQTPGPNQASGEICTNSDAMRVLFAFVSPKMIPKIFIIFSLREKHKKRG